MNDDDGLQLEYGSIVTSYSLMQKSMPPLLNRETQASHLECQLELSEMKLIYIV